MNNINICEFIIKFIIEINYGRCSQYKQVYMDSKYGATF